MKFDMKKPNDKDTSAEIWNCISTGDLKKIMKLMEGYNSGDHEYRHPLGHQAAGQCGVNKENFKGTPEYESKKKLFQMQDDIFKYLVLHPKMLQKIHPIPLPVQFPFRPLAYCDSMTIPSPIPNENYYFDHYWNSVIERLAATMCSHNFCPEMANWVRKNIHPNMTIDNFKYNKDTAHCKLLFDFHAPVEGWKCICGCQNMVNT